MDILNIAGFKNAELKVLSHEENNKGLDLIKSNDYETALLCFNNAIECNEKNAGAHANRGIVLMELGKYADAEGSLRQAIGLGAETKVVYTKLVVTLSFLKKYGESLKYVDIALDHDLGDGFLLELKAKTLYYMDRHLDATVCCGKAIKAGRGNYHLYMYYGMALVSCGEHEKSLAAFDKSIEYGPYKAMPYEKKGGAYYELEKYEKSIACYDKAIIMDPENGFYFFNRGMSKHYNGDRKGTFDDLMKAVDLLRKEADPTNKGRVASDEKITEIKKLLSLMGF